jgi:hypothetical protein
MKTRLDRPGQVAQKAIWTPLLIALVEAVKIHIWNTRSGPRMREIWLREDLHIAHAVNGSRGQFDRPTQPNPSLELYFDT